MTRYTEMLARIQSLRHSESTDNDNTSFSAMRSSSPATSAADAAVQKHDAEDAEAATRSSPPPSSDDNDGYASYSGLSRPPTIIKRIQPQPTLSLPPNYPFRTTDLGYPIFRTMLHPKTQRVEPRRATMSTAQGFTDPRITAFVDYYTKFYTDMGEQPDGMHDLQLCCTVRGLVTYGTKDKLVVRLVERALRDAARGWSEISRNAGIVVYEEAPDLPGVAYDADVSMEDSP